MRLERGEACSRPGAVCKGGAPRRPGPGDGPSGGSFMGDLLVVALALAFLYIVGAALLGALRLLAREWGAMGLG